MFEFLNTWLSAGWWVAILLIIAGCTALIKGASWLVDGASGLAKQYGISDIVIGLTVVAFGTSMPEFVVNMVAVGQGNSEIAITNVLGSNIINTFVILGMTALIYPISSQRQSRHFDIPWSALGALLVLLFATYNSPAWLNIEGWLNIHINNPSLRDIGSLAWGAGSMSFISRVGGTILWVFFIFYLWQTFKSSQEGSAVDSWWSSRIGDWWRSHCEKRY